MDTVIGCEGSRKVLLTMHFCTCDIMAAFLLDSKETTGVEKVFDSINKAYRYMAFQHRNPPDTYRQGRRVQTSGQA